MIFADGAYAVGSLIEGAFGVGKLTIVQVPWTVLQVPRVGSGDLVTDAVLAAAALFVALAVAMLYRAIRGPTMQDRVLAVNVLGTNTVVVLALLAAGLGESSFLDIALVYALLNFLMAVAVSKFTVERGGVI